MKLPTLLILITATTLSAKTFQTPDTSRFSIEVGFGFGNYAGVMIDKDDEYYRNIGFGLVDKKGKTMPVDPYGTSLVLEAGCFLNLAPHLAIGPAYKYQNVSEQPDMPVKDEDGADLLSANILLAKVRWEPLGFQNVRVGMEGGLGIGFGTLRRFGLAADHMDIITNNLQSQAATLNLSATDIGAMTSYGTEGNRPLDLMGLHYKLAVRVSALLRAGWGLCGTMGFEGTNWKVTGDDPLATRVTKYPSSPTGYGFELTVGAFKEF